MSRNINFPDKAVSKVYTTPAAVPWSSYPVTLSGVAGVIDPVATPGRLTGGAGFVAAGAGSHIGSKLVILSGPNRGVYTITVRNGAGDVTITPAPTVAEVGITWYAGGVYLPLALGTNGCLGLKKIRGLLLNGLVVAGAGYIGVPFTVLTNAASFKGTLIVQLFNTTTGAEALTTVNFGGQVVNVRAVGS